MTEESVIFDANASAESTFPLRGRLRDAISLKFMHEIWSIQKNIVFVTAENQAISKNDVQTKPSPKGEGGPR